MAGPTSYTRLVCKRLLSSCRCRFKHGPPLAEHMAKLEDVFSILCTRKGTENLNTFGLKQHGPSLTEHMDRLKDVFGILCTRQGTKNPNTLCLKLKRVDRSVASLCW